jgi:hypothetical protein
MITVNVLQSSGSDGEALTAFEIKDDTLQDQMYVSQRDLLDKGRTEETDEEIKENAIVFKNTGNRAITKYDYIAITRRQELVKEAYAWGGEEEYEEVLGNIWISCTPFIQNRPIVKYRNGYRVEVGLNQYEDEFNEVQKDWDNWYLRDTSYDKIIDYLDRYKIMTMKINHRHPLYINFDYNIDVVKYSVTQNMDTTNYIIFSAINKFFEDKIERFDSEYLNSNLQRILDTVLEYKTGVNIKLKLTGTLFENMYDKYYLENKNRKKIITSLSWPYETIVTLRKLYWDRLPRIDGEFGYNNGQLKVDLSVFENVVKPKRTADIMYFKATQDPETDEGTKVGEYTIDTEKYNIDLLWDFTEIGSEEIFGPIDDDSKRRGYVEFPISYYPFDDNVVNLPFGKNRMPRLRNVEFSLI